MTSELLKERYQTIRELGSGGFGKTFLAEDTHMPSRRKCVIKQLKLVSDNPQIYQLVQQRFDREAALLEELGDRHERIPRLYAYFNEKERFYLVEEWIEGQTLNEKIVQDGSLSESAVKELLLSLLPVLEYIQTKGIIHRDIKPENIILRASDGLPALIDFGAVKETMATIISPSGRSQRSIIAGTPGFMASEQCAGRPVFASDLYALGLTAIYLLTGKLPSELETDPHTGEIHWRHLASQISQNFAAFLDKAILPNARDRYINAKVMLEALQTLPKSAPDTLITSPSKLQNPTLIPSTNDLGTTATPPTRLDLPPATVDQCSRLGGGGTFNEFVPVPSEIRGWNWGAFLLPGLWPLSNKVWIGLLSWVPLVGIVMRFILGAKGNAWAWRSRQWKSIQDFKAHQRAWTIAGLVVYGSLFALVAVVSLVEQDPEFQTQNQNPEDNPTQPQQLNQPSNPDPSVSSSPPTPSIQPSLDSPEEPPTINIGGKIERATKPTAFIDGYWRLDFSVGAINHQSILYMNGISGEMVTQYFDPPANRTQKVLQTIKLWSCSQGLIVKGYNPVDFNTQQPHPTYQPDEIFMQQKPDGSFYADNCSGGTCSTVRVQYIGKTLK
jgi:serine/threonine-protein kinase